MPQIFNRRFGEHPTAQEYEKLVESLERYLMKQAAFDIDTFGRLQRRMMQWTELDKMSGDGYWKLEALSFVIEGERSKDIHIATEENVVTHVTEEKKKDSPDRNESPARLRRLAPVLPT